MYYNNLKAIIINELLIRRIYNYKFTVTLFDTCRISMYIRTSSVCECKFACVCVFDILINLFICASYVEIVDSRVGTIVVSD